MSARTRSRLVVAIAIAAGPLFAIGACGGDVDGSVSGPDDDAAADRVAFDSSTLDAELDATTRDASRPDAPADAHVDASEADAGNTPNRCGGYATLEYAGSPATPGDSCGACSDGTLVCIGSDSVACAGATSAPCPTPPVDAGPNECGGYGPLTFQSSDAAVGDPCGSCGRINCASTTSFACTEPSLCGPDASVPAACSIPDAAYTASASTPTLPAETRPTVTTTASIALPAGGLVFNPYDGLLYASISSGVSQGNSIAAIDPTTASVLRTVYVGPSPSLVAISDDGNALWVVVSGSSSIRRVDLTTFTVGTMIALTPGFTVSSLQVLAGTEDSIAVTSRGYELSTIVYDNGTPRPHGSRNANPAATIATASASLLLLAQTNTLNGMVGTLCVSPEGVFLQGYTGKVTHSVAGAPVLFGGVIYNTDGTTFDARTAASLHTFGVAPDDTNTLVTADAKDVYYLTSLYKGGIGNVVAVTGFDRATYAETATDPLASNGGTNGSFTRWGRYGFAYVNGTKSIQIARSTIIADQP